MSPLWAKQFDGPPRNSCWRFALRFPSQQQADEEKPQRASLLLQVLPSKKLEIASYRSAH
jgi:hypothetical protein